MAWAFNLKYLSNSQSSGLLGPGFNYSPNLHLEEVVGGIDLWTGEFTNERFEEVAPGVYAPAADNNSQATLRIMGSGSAERFVLTSNKGVVTIFYGFDGAIDTPGRVESITDRFGNHQSYDWIRTGTVDQLASVTDAYGRTVEYRYYGSEQGYLLREIEDFLGRKLNFQYDEQEHLVAVVTPSIDRAAEGNTFPGGTAYVFEYDVDNIRPERRDDLIRIWYPNQTLPYLDTQTRTVNVDEVYQNATPRYVVEYGQDPTDSDFWGRVLYETVGNPAGGVGGTYSFLYSTNPTELPTNILDPDDPVVFRCIVTDRNGNQSIHDFNAAQMPVRVEKLKTRNKNSLEASSYITWTQYNENNQPLLIVRPEGNSLEFEYESGVVSGIGDYAPRKGLLLRQTRRPGNPYKTSNSNFPSDPTNPAYLIPAPRDSASNGQTELTRRFFYDPLFNRQVAMIEERGNPVAAGNTYFTPQNGGTTPTNADRSRYATITYLDYQKNTVSTVINNTVLQDLLGLTNTEVQALIDHVDDQMTDTGGSGGIPSGFEMNLGDINGDGTGDGASSGLVAANILGNMVKVKHPAVRLIGVSSITTQTREELFTVNDRGQVTTHTDPEGNLAIYLRYPYSDPEGDGQDTAPGLGNKQYGYLKEVHVDADPGQVLSLIGSDGDLVDFIGGIIARTNTSGVYQDLVTRYEGSASGGCGACAYDALGNPLAKTDPRGFTTQYARNELGEVFRTTSPQPYLFRVESHYDANRNVVRVDTEDKVVQYTSDDPTSADYAHFVPSGSGSTAHVPMKAGPGGSVRPGWFTNLSAFDLLDNRIEEDIDATGSSPSSLVTQYAYDSNQNLIKITKPEENTVEYDYDERDLQIAERIGYDPTLSQPGAVTVRVYDKNGNLLEVIGPAARGGAGNHRTVTIQDAFRSASSLTHTGDWLVENTIDGFDRVISVKDSVGNVAESKHDPDSRVVESIRKGPVGGATPTNRTGSGNVDLAISISRFDEAGRKYEAQQDVFLASGTTLPSSRTVTHTGGGLETNSTSNGHTGTVTLTTGGSSYVLSRSVFDRSGRATDVLADNTGHAQFAYDGANRQVQQLDALDNRVDFEHDANGNVVFVTRTEKCTITEPTVADEIFRSALRYDSLGRLVVSAVQGADGTISSDLSDSQTLFTLTGYDSRDNTTLRIDPKQNSVLTVFDGAGRSLRTDQHLRQRGQGDQPPAESTTFLPGGGACISTRTFYDGNGRVTQLVDDRGGVTAFAYDTLDRQTKLIFHDGSERVSAFNKAGNVVTYTDENGSVFANTFDALGRKTAVSISLASGVIGTTAQSFEYDGLSRNTFARDSISSTHADVSLRYDSLSRVLEDSQAYGGNTRNVTNANYFSIVPIWINYPNDSQMSDQGLSIGYDILYRYTLVYKTFDVQLARWEYFGPSRVAEISLYNGLICTWMNNSRTRSAVQEGESSPSWGDQSSDRLGYDGAGRMITKRFLAAAYNETLGGYDNTTSLVGFTSAYDKASNKLYERALQAESRSHLYEPIVDSEPQGGYDSLNRLRQYQRGALASGGGSVNSPIVLPNTDEFRTYDLDGLGNWKKTVYEPVGGAETTQVRQYNYLNEITRTTIASADTDFSYDGIPGASNGNLADDGVRTYEWDALNRLKKVYKNPSSPALIGEYTYDAFGRRIRKVVTNGGLSGTIPNGTTDYLYNSRWQCVEERDGSNDPTNQYVWGIYIDELMTQLVFDEFGFNEHFPLQDLLYRTMAVTEQDGNIIEAFDYDAYGNTLIFSSAGTGGNWWADDATQSTTTACTRLYQGHAYDSELELYNFRNRYYAQKLGVFASRDRVPAFNPFQFVQSNPTVRIDPLGLKPVSQDYFEQDVINSWTHDIGWFDTDWGNMIFWTTDDSSVDISTHLKANNNCQRTNDIEIKIKVSDFRDQLFNAFGYSKYEGSLETIIECDPCKIVLGTSIRKKKMEISKFGHLTITVWTSLEAKRIPGCCCVFQVYFDVTYDNRLSQANSGGIDVTILSSGGGLSSDGGSASGGSVGKTFSLEVGGCPQDSQGCCPGDPPPEPKHRVYNAFGDRLE
jgi:RHS repeat-associated protein